MCGKFTAMYSWREVHAFSQPLTIKHGGGDARAADDHASESNDSVITYRPMDPLPVIVWDESARTRRIIPMRWGFPHRSNPNRPDPIHARSESVDERGAFKDVFLGGQRGIVVFRTFNEGRDLSKSKTEQWTIDPGDGLPRGFAFIWRKFEPKGEPPFFAAVMCTVPASELIRRTVMPEEPDPRMPAILEDSDWPLWLGEAAATPDAVKATLKTMEGVHWRAFPEPRGKKAPRAPTHI